jgi:hypothetical protein
VVVVSAFLENGPGMEVQGFVGKPIDFDHLSKLIKQYCD